MFRSTVRRGAGQLLLMLVLPVCFYLAALHWSPQVAAWLSVRVTSVRIPQHLSHTDALNVARFAGLLGLALDVTMLRSGDPR